MSYHLHITRKSNRWDDATDPVAISRAEWLAYIASDSEMRLNNYGLDPLYTGGDVDADFAYEEHLEGLASWLGHSGRGLKGKHVWLSYEEGRITVENPDEETLGKMLAIAHALGARVQGDDGEYFDESPAYMADTHEGTIFEASTDFRDFQTFASAEAAQPLLAALARQDILARTTFDNGQLAFDPSFANNQLTSKYIVKVQLDDFERASQVLADINAHALSQADPTHYLFSFTDEELFDLLVKPDEWSAYDVALAGQLLRQRGRDISPDTLRLLRQRRVAELATPPQDHQALIVGGYLSALLGGFFGLLVGYQLYFNRRLLPDGRRVYSYSATDRVHGLRILVLGAVVFVLVLGLQIMRVSDDY